MRHGLSSFVKGDTRALGPPVATRVFSVAPPMAASRSTIFEVAPPLKDTVAPKVSTNGKTRFRASVAIDVLNREFSEKVETLRLNTFTRIDDMETRLTLLEKSQSRDRSMRRILMGMAVVAVVISVISLVF